MTQSKIHFIINFTMEWSKYQLLTSKLKFIIIIYHANNLILKQLTYSNIDYEEKWTVDSCGQLHARQTENIKNDNDKARMW